MLDQFSYFVLLSAAELILEGQAGAVLAADIIPTWLVKASGPFWTHLVPYPVRFWSAGIAATASFYVVAFVPDTWGRLLGVCVASWASGFGEISGLALTARYSPATIGAWSSGTGFAGLFGAGLVVVLDDVLKLTPAMTLTICGVISAAWPFVFSCLLTRSTRRQSAASGAVSVVPLTPAVAAAAREREHDSREGGGGAEDDARSVGGISLPELRPGSPAEGESSHASALESGERMGLLSADRLGATDVLTAHTMTACDRLRAVARLWPFMVPMATVYFLEYYVNVGFASTLSFAGVSRKSFFEHASFAYQIGVFVSRSSGALLQLKSLWALPALQFLNLLVFVAQGLWNVLPSEWAMLLITLWVGLLGGTLYVNAFRLVREHSPPALKEFSLGAASLADTSGIVVASLAALYTESALDAFRDGRGFDG